MGRWFRWYRLRRSSVHGGKSTPYMGRSEWRGARRRRRRAIVGGAVVAAIVAGAGVSMWIVLVGGGGSKDQGQGKNEPLPGCRTAPLPGRLGLLAWVRDGRLLLIDLDTCAHRTLARSGATQPVRFSPDGKWVAYGDGNVVPARGGEATRPLGEVASWQWSPSNDLVGITGNGRVVVGAVSGRPSTVVQRGVESAAVSPSGRVLAIGIGNRVITVPTDGGRTQTLFVAARKDRPEVAGWSPGGRWVLFWVHAPKKVTAPLDAVPVNGGGYHNVFDPVLPYGDFLTWCGETLAVSGGGEETPSQGQQLLVSAPPDWRTHNLSADFRSSWIWPACSSDGKQIAVTLTPNHTEDPPGDGQRSVWVISIDGQDRRRIARALNKAYEVPRWSTNGRVVMVVERETDPESEGTVILIVIDPKTGKAKKTVQGVANLGPSPDKAGHPSWSALSDWYRP